MISVDKIAKLIDGKIIGDATHQVENICDIEKGKSNCITYISNDKYIKYLKNNNASVFIVNNDFDLCDYDKIFIKVLDPPSSFIKVINLFYPRLKKEPSICSSSAIGENVKLGDNLYIGPNVVIEDNVVIGDNVFINSGTYIGENTKIGKYTEIFSNVLPSTIKDVVIKNKKPHNPIKLFVNITSSSLFIVG